jgi:hypothetical protein
MKIRGQRALSPLLETVQRYRLGVSCASFACPLFLALLKGGVLVYDEIGDDAVGAE